MTTTLPPAFDWQMVPGWFAPSQADVYRALVSRFPGGQMVEVGCWKGRSLASVLPTCQALGYAHVGAVDTWAGSPSELATHHAEALTTDLYAAFCATMIAGGWDGLVVPMRGESTVAAARYAPASLDLVFIDGEHTEAAVTADLCAWLPRVKPGGVLAGHDWQIPAVREAVTARLGTVATAENIWWVTA